MGAMNPRGIPDLGSVAGHDDSTLGQAAAIQSYLERKFPGRLISVTPVGSPEPSRRPAGYNSVRVYLHRGESESTEAFAATRQLLEHILSDTETNLGQPSSGESYVKVDPPDGCSTPVPETSPDGASRVVGCTVVLHVSPTLVSAEGVEQFQAALGRSGYRSE